MFLQHIKNLRTWSEKSNKKYNYPIYAKKLGVNLWSPGPWANFFILSGANLGIIISTSVKIGCHGIKHDVLSCIYTPYKRYIGGLPCGTVVKNPPANAGDMGSSPGQGRDHMPQSN